MPNIMMINVLVTWNIGRMGNPWVFLPAQLNAADGMSKKIVIKKDKGPRTKYSKMR